MSAPNRRQREKARYLNTQDRYPSAEKVESERRQFRQSEDATAYGPVSHFVNGQKTNGAP